MGDDINYYNEVTHTNIYPYPYINTYFSKSTP